MTNPLDHNQIFGTLERSIGLAIGNDGLGLGLTDTAEVIGQGLGIGIVDIDRSGDHYGRYGKQGGGQQGLQWR